MLCTDGLFCVVVGAGDVGCRKLADVLKTDVARVLVLDTAPPSPALLGFLEDPRVVFAQRAFVATDLENFDNPKCPEPRANLESLEHQGQPAGLVFAATANAQVNAAVVEACAARGILCNCADAPESSGFIVPARVCRGRVTLTVSTQGGSPALARHLRESLETFAEPFAALAELLARLRPMVLALGHESVHNKELFRSLVASDLREAMATKDAGRCEALLRGLLPVALHPRITELLHELV